jgi:hypothetical protein
MTKLGTGSSDLDGDGKCWSNPCLSYADHRGHDVHSSGAVIVLSPPSRTDPSLRADRRVAFGRGPTHHSSAACRGRHRVFGELANARAVFLPVESNQPSAGR